MYLNGNQIAVINTMPSASTLALTSGWESLGTSSHYISWAQGTTVAVVAAAIAVYLGTLGAAGVIAAMGVAALGVIAANSIGGTLEVEFQMYTVPLAAPQYRYIWSFTASTGDKYGPYVSHVTF